MSRDMCGMNILITSNIALQQLSPRMTGRAIEVRRWRAPRRNGDGMTAGNNPSSKRATPQGRDVVARARTGGRRTTPLWAGAGVRVTAAGVTVLIIAVTGCTGTHTSDTASSSLKSAPATFAAGTETPPPWPAPTDV